MVNPMKIKNFVFLSILTSIVSCTAEVNRNGAYDWGSSQSILFYELIDKPIKAAATQVANTETFSAGTIPTGWTGTWVISSDSFYCASIPCLASLSSSQSSAISVTRTVRAGKMTFLWRSSAQSSSDSCSFTIDGSSPGTGSTLASSFPPLTSASFTISTAGSKVFRWNYAKSSSSSFSQCYIDTIVFP